MKSRRQGGLLKRGKKSRSRAVARITAPRTAGEYFSKSEHFQDLWNRMTHVVSKMRADEVSLQQASREFGLAPRTVIRWGGSALRKRKNGRYVARPSDRLLRVLVIPTNAGLREIGVPDSRQATLLGGYWDAVQKYLETGDTSALRKYQYKRIKDADRAHWLLLTDVEELDRLGSAGVLSFESLYAKVA